MGDFIFINQYSRGNAYQFNNITVNNGAAASAASEQDRNGTAEAQEYAEDVEFEEETPSCAIVATPPTSAVDCIFYDYIRLPELKRRLGELIGQRQQVQRIKIVDWYIVWAFFRSRRFLDDQTQTKFVRWVDDTFGWEWSTTDFKSSVPGEVKNAPIDQWDEGQHSPSAQKPTAKDYIAWRDALADAFLEAPDKHGRRACKAEFRTRYFDTSRR